MVLERGESAGVYGGDCWSMEESAGAWRRVLEYRESARVWRRECAWRRVLEYGEEWWSME
jgi:hypothetical protein